MNRHSSKSICVTRLLFCQNDFPMGDHSGNRTKHTLELFMPIMIFSPVANLMHNPLGTWRLPISVTYLGEFWDISCFFSNFSEEMLNVEPITWIFNFVEFFSGKTISDEHESQTFSMNYHTLEDSLETTPTLPSGE